MGDTQEPGTTLVQFNVNLAAADAEMSRRVQRTSIFVGSSLTAATNLSDPLPTLQAGLVQMIAPPSWQANELRDDFSAWVLSAGFREIADAIALLLEQLYQVALLWKLLPTSGTRMTVPEWAKSFDAPRVAFHKFGLPEKVTAMEKLGVPLDPRDAARLASINAVRNCLVHRQGVVGPKDIDASGDLRLIGSKLSMYILRHSGEVEEVTNLPVHVEAGESREMREEDIISTFPVGSKVQIDAGHFSAAGLALILAGNRTRDVVAKFGQKLGHLPPSASV